MCICVSSSATITVSEEDILENMRYFSKEKGKNPSVYMGIWVSIYNVCAIPDLLGCYA